MYFLARKNPCDIKPVLSVRIHPTLRKIIIGSVNNSRKKTISKEVLIRIGKSMSEDEIKVYLENTPVDDYLHIFLKKLSKK